MVGKPYLHGFRADFRASNARKIAPEIVVHLIANLPRTSISAHSPIISMAWTTDVDHLTANLIAYLTPT